MSRNNTAVVMYSGGGDSTLAAVLLMERFRKVDLLTYRCFGIGDVKRSEVNFQILTERFGEERISHYYINVDKILSLISYENYLSNLKRWGFAMLLTCAFCKLAMHTRTIVYCLDNNISTAADGANKWMQIYPCQMKCCIGLIRDFYASFGIEYLAPVYEYYDEYGIRQQSFLYKTKPFPRPEGAKTCGEVLYEMGLAPVKDLSRSRYARKIQDKCYGMVLMNIYVRWYFLQRRSYAQYQEMVKSFVTEKVAFCQEMIRDYIAKGADSRLGKTLLSRGKLRQYSSALERG